MDYNISVPLEDSQALTEGKTDFIPHPHQMWHGAVICLVHLVIMAPREEKLWMVGCMKVT